MIQHALAVSRRVFFVSLALVVCFGAGAWLLLPDVDDHRADVEAFLKDELGLEALKLGELSWYWAGYIGVKARTCSLASRNGSLSVQDSAVTIHLSMFDLLLGRLVPSGIHLKGGAMKLVVGTMEQGASLPLPDRITLEETTLDWKYRELSGHLERVTASLESQGGELRVRIPGSSLEASFDENLMPGDIDLEFSGLTCFPQQWRDAIDGDISGHITISGNRRGSWKGRFALSSLGSDPAAIALLNNRWLFDELGGEVELALTEEEGTISLVRFHSVHWREKESRMSGNAEWRGGKLSLAVEAPRLAMPLIWQSLKPLGGDSWHRWLAGMKRGVASEVRADVELPWALPLHGAPQKEEIALLRYKITGHVEDADVSLGIHEDFITGTTGDVEIDETGLKAIIASTRLPHEIGMVKGGLHIPWHGLILEINGNGNVDVGRIHRWVDEREADLAGWQEGAAKAEFTINWVPEENEPREAYLKLQPSKVWKLKMKSVPVTVRSGELSWRFGKGIEFTGVSWSTPHLNIESDVRAVKNEAGHWQVNSMRSTGEGELAALTSYFFLPVESPSGRVAFKLDFDGRWQGSIGLTQATWSNFLGTKKDEGETAVIIISGENGIRFGEQALVINEIRCDDRLIRMSGSGDVSAQGLHLSLDRVETASFTGSVGITAPFGSDPWELDIDAAYLNRNALPATVARDARVGKKPWALRAKLNRFVWDDAEIRGAEIRLASALNSIAVLKAVSLKSRETDMHNLSAIFSLPGGGVVDLRKLEAEIDILRLELSATLYPDAGRGMRWRGFASLQGDFGEMMKRTGLSNLFEHGDMQMLFSGQGMALTDQPWWKSLDGRMRMRVNNGRIMKGGTLSKFFAAISITDLPGLFFGNRDDLTKPGLGYKRMQMEALIHGKNVQLYNLALRSSAMDVAGKGAMDIESSMVDMTLVMRPFQNLDALLAKVPIIRDIFGGQAHSFIRRVYRLHGPIANAEVERISPEEAGLASPGMVERLLNLPSSWFGEGKSRKEQTPG